VKRRRREDGGTTVRPLVTAQGTVVCHECLAPMEPVEYLDFEGGRTRWLFWRCQGVSGHITEMIPLP
jgi:hypothetical protein